MTQPPATPPPEHSPTAPPAPPRRTRRGMTLAAVALAAVLVLAAGGLAAWLLWDTDRDGPAEPTTAVNAFLSAIYIDHDPSAAAAVVCREARDEPALAAQISNIRQHAEAHDGQQFSWDEPQQTDQTDQLAIMSVTVTMVTADERIAEQTLRISVLDKDTDGWWVCNVASGADDDPPEQDDE